MTGSTRPIAGDVGTDNRIECEAGHYWVRLWSREAIRREGDAMANCLRQGAFQSHAGSDDPAQNGLWSLRDGSGKSVALALLSGGLPPMNLVSFLGPQNAMASALAYRQLRHLAAYFFDAHTRFVLYESTIKEPVVVGPDGATYRWDRAPKALRRPDHDARLEARRREHEEAKRRREAADRMRENQPPIPEGEVGRPHYYGDGLDPDQPMFGVQAGLVGDPIDFTNGITLIARTNGRFRAMIQTGVLYRIIENATLYPLADLDAAFPDSVRIEDVPSREWPNPRSVIYAGAEAFARLSAMLPDPEATEIQCTIGVDIAQGRERSTVVDWCDPNRRLASQPIRGRPERIRAMLGPPIVAQDFVRYEPATEYRGVLPDGLLYATQRSPDGAAINTIIVTASNGRQVTAMEVYSNGRIALEFAPQEFVEVRSAELRGNPVIARYPVPASPGGRRDARIVSDYRVDDWRGAMP